MSQKIYNIDDLIILFDNMDELDFVELQLQLQSVKETRNSNEVKMKQNIILDFIKSITKRIINTTERTYNNPTEEYTLISMLAREI